MGPGVLVGCLFGSLSPIVIKSIAWVTLQINNLKKMATHTHVIAVLQLDNTVLYNFRLYAYVYIIYIWAKHRGSCH